MLQNLCIAAAYRPVQELLEEERKVHAFEYVFKSNLICFLKVLRKEYSNTVFLLGDMFVATQSFPALVLNIKTFDMLFCYLICMLLHFPFHIGTRMITMFTIS